MEKTILLYQPAAALLTLFLLTSQGVSQTDFWEQTSGPPGVVVNTLAINGSNHTFAGTRFAGVVRSQDNGDNWAEINEGLGGRNTIHTIAINRNGDIFAGMVAGAFRSTDNGDNWSKKLTGNVLSLAINPSNGDIFAGTEFGTVHRSTDNGDNWTTTALKDTFIFAITVNNKGDVFAGAGLGGGLFRSTDNGDSWEHVLTVGNVDALTVNSQNHIFAGTGAGVFRSTDNGDNWTQMNNGLTAINVKDFAINSDGDIFAGVFGGVFVSFDNGANWTGVNSGLTNLGIGAVAINSNGIIFAGSSGDGVFRSFNPTTSIEESVPLIPASFKLRQNYPNPFNPSTTIQFEVAERTHVSLKIFDILGREIAVLVNETLAPNLYRTNFEAGDLPNGVYFYRLQAGEFSQTKKLILLK